MVSFQDARDENIEHDKKVELRSTEQNWNMIDFKKIDK